MKPKTIFIIIIAVIAAAFIASGIYNLVNYNQKQDLKDQILLSQGKNMVNEILIEKLKTDTSLYHTQFTSLVASTEKLALEYKKKIRERDNIIAFNKKENERISNFTASQALQYFYNRTGAPDMTDSTFLVPQTNIKIADALFSDLDTQYAENENYRISEVVLTGVNNDLQLQVDNRQQMIMKLNEMGIIKDRQAEELKTQVELQAKALLKTERKAKIDKIEKRILLGASIVATAIAILK